MTPRTAGSGSPAPTGDEEAPVGAATRDLHKRADGDLSRVLLVSTDADIKRACQEWGLSAPLMRGWGQLLETLFTFTLDDSHATVTRLIVSVTAAQVREIIRTGEPFTVPEPVTASVTRVLRGSCRNTYTPELAALPCAGTATPAA